MHPRSKAQEWRKNIGIARTSAVSEPTSYVASPLITPLRPVPRRQVKDLSRELLFGGSCSTKQFAEYVRDLGLKCS